MLPDRTWPFQVRPGSFETIDSYLRRLRIANFVTDHAWSAWLKPTVRATGMKLDDALPLIAEAIAGLDSGYFARVRAALPQHENHETCVHCATGLEERYGCARCTPGERVEQAPHDGPRVCRKHMMWVGPGTVPESQYPVDIEVLRADRAYRRLRRRGLIDAHRLAEILTCVDDWVEAEAEDASLNTARRFALAIRLGQRIFRPRTIDAYAARDAAANVRYSALTAAITDITGTDACTVLTDSVWLLIRSAGHQDQKSPHRFRCSPKEPNMDERDELRQLRTSAYPRGRHLHLSQYVSSDLPGSKREREQQTTPLNKYVCSRGHRFAQSVRTLRVTKTGVGCGVCSNNTLLRGFNSLADTDPHLTAFWHSSKNGDLRPEDVISKSDITVFWTCDKGHDYEMKVSRKRRGTRCPFCTNNRVAASINSFAVTHPAAADGWHPQRNGEKTPGDFVAGSSHFAWWSCAEHDAFRMRIANRVVLGHGCPYCTRQKVHPANCFAVAHPREAARWHPSRNGSRTPFDVLSGSGEKFWWVCEKNNHHYFAAVLTQSRGAGCNICSGHVVDEQNSMRTTRPDLAREFHPTANGSMTPDNIMASTTKLITWMCENKHHWIASGHNRAKKGTGCPYCSNRSCWPGWNDLATTHPALLADWDWDSNGDIDPHTIIAGTNSHVAWRCAECHHHWIARGSRRVRGSGCPNCYRTKPRRRQR